MLAGPEREEATVHLVLYTHHTEDLFVIEGGPPDGHGLVKLLERVSALVTDRSRRVVIPLAGWMLCLWLAPACP